MASVIKGASLPKSFDVKGLWKHEMATAAIAKILAAELGGPDGAWGPSADENSRLVIDPDEAGQRGNAEAAIQWVSLTLPQRQGENADEGKTHCIEAGEVVAPDAVPLELGIDGGE